MKRKTIGVFLSGDDEQLHGTFLHGIKEASKQYNCDIVCFYNLFNKAPFGTDIILAPSIKRGESSIFYGHSFSQLDAIIIFGDSFFSSEIKDNIINKAIQHNIPVIDVDDTDDRCTCINYSDEFGMEIMINHLIKDHGCRKIYMVSGYPGNKQSEERNHAYRKVLAENNIPFNEEFICYGKFFGPYAAENIAPIIEKYGLPDAIACANDAMAITIVSYLNSLGYNVPNDCIVTGFDGIKEGKIYRPSITSIGRAIYASGAKAVELACKAIEGESLEKQVIMESVLIKLNSCGCVPIEEFTFDKFYELMTERVNDRDYFYTILNDMARSFNNCESVDEILTTAFKSAHFFHSPEIAFYLCENIAVSSKISIVNDIFQHKTNNEFYTNTMTGIKWTQDKGLGDYYYVNIDNFISETLSQYDEPTFLGLSPLYYQERIIGFITMDHTYCTNQITMLYTWIVNTCAAIGNHCLRSEMSMLIDELDTLSVKDTLTKLYNRLGLHRNAKNIERQAIINNTRSFGILIDLDGLKIINDTYGHNAGDNAIMQIANAMRAASKNNEILSRIGGDEYFVFGNCRSEQEPINFIKQIREYLDEYNRTTNLPYMIECSCGYYISTSVKDNLETIMRIADSEMYKDKVARKHSHK